MPGYEDYQRLVNFDSSPFLQEEAVAHENEVTLGRFSVSRYASLVGRLRFTNANIAVTFQWWTEQTGGILLGERTFRMDTLSAAFAEICIPHMGPWLSVTYTPEVLATPYKSTVTLLSSNRPMPYNFTPRVPTVTFIPGSTLIKAGAGFTQRASVYYAGPCEMFTESAQEGFEINIQGLVRSFTYETFWQLQVPGKRAVAKLILPFTQVRFSINNTGAAESNYTLVVVPSITGSD